MKSTISKMVLVLTIMCFVAFTSPLTLFATSLDDLSSGSTINNIQNSTENNVNYASSRDESDSNAISGYLSGYTPVTQSNMQSASKIASPIVNVIGTASGFIIMIASAGIFLITALDLLYIGIPPIREILNPQLASAGASPMGGMSMGGMGMGMGMRGGMGMGGAPMGATPSSGRKWVSDEAIACVSMSATNAQPQAGGMPMGGMGMGGMGGMGMGMPMGGAPQSSPTPTKSVILEYLKKRMFFIIIFSVATVILMSSVLTDCGLNIAELLQKIFEKVNGQIGSVNIQ